MEFNSTVVGIIVLLIILIPVAYLIVNTSGKDKKIKNSVIELTKAQGVNLQEMEVIGNLIIGIDEVSKKLVYTSKLNPTSDLMIVDMESVKHCRTKTLRQGENSLDWVGLELVEREGKREIPFYLEIDDTGLSRDPFVRLQDAKKWERRILPFLKAS